MNNRPLMLIMMLVGVMFLSACWPARTLYVCWIMPDTDEEGLYLPPEEVGMCEVQSHTFILKEDIGPEFEEDFDHYYAFSVPCEDEMVTIHLYWYNPDVTHYRIRAERITYDSYGEPVHLSWSEWSENAEQQGEGGSCGP